MLSRQRLVKTLIILIGPPGSGKSTYAKSLKNCVRVSQDDQGRFGQLKTFEDAIKAGHDVVIDRMNHTPEQRKVYIEPARAKGYFVRIVWFKPDFNQAFERLLKRTEHPTIEPGDYETMSRALTMYYKVMKDPTPDEYDIIQEIPNETY